MITKLSDFLTEKKKLQQIKENTDSSENNDGAIEGAEILKSTINDIAKELGINANEIEAQIEQEYTGKTNENFIDTMSNAITTFGDEIYNVQHISFTSGLIGLLIAASVVITSGFVGLTMANKKVKKAIIAYINFKYGDELKNIDPKNIKDFVVEKTEEIKADKPLLAQIEKNPEYFIRKYSKK